jgi:phospholipid N-methyltransferase
MTSPSTADESPASLFFRKFLRHGTRVASVAPSSRSLARAMCAHVDADRPQTILELGAGTGPVTEEVARQMHPDSRLLAVEIDRDFADMLQRRCPRAEVICCDARDLADELAARDVDTIDLVLSGLPTPSLPRAVNEPVLACVERWAPDAIFSQLTVMPWVYQRMYRRLFHDVRFTLVPANLPPGGVYHCRGLRATWNEHVPGKAA